MSKKMTPDIRFKGYTQDWEQRKLGKVTYFFNEKRVPIDSEKRKSGKYPYYGATGIIDYVDGYIFDGEYVLLAEDGANILMRNRPLVYLTQGKFWLNNHAHVMKIKDGSNEFLLQLLEKQNYVKYNSGTAQPKLNSQVVKKIPLNFPKKEEQIKIGNFFKKIDETIALHQGKLEKLKQLKKGYMQRMFPEKIEKMPSLRFANFSQDWEQRKFKDFLSIKSGRDYKHLGIGEIPVYGTGGYMLSVDDKLSNQDAIGLGRKGTINKPQYLKAPFWTVDTLFFMIPKQKFDLLFLYSMTQKINWKKMDESTGVPSLSKAVIEKVHQKVPSDQEQLKIGLFFKTLDDTIALHQKNISTLQGIKKLYLRKMFA